MNIDARKVIAPLAALAILVLVVTQTRDALRLSGAWRKVARVHPAVAADPFAPVDQQLAAPPVSAPPALRDPFGSPSVPVAVVRNSNVVVQKPRPKPPPSPVLTSIIFDADPRATIRWDGRDYSVRSGALFADFRVVSISRGQVTLDHGGTPVVLSLPRKGE